jgi:SAM-dependent methyltransferase
MTLVTHPTYGYRHVASPPDTEALAEFYRSHFYSEAKPAYLEAQQAEYPYWCHLWQMRLALMAKRLGGKGKLLDLGAGGGFFLNCAAEHGWSISGIEPSSSACAYAGTQFGLALFQGVIDDLPDSDGPFDAIHLSLVLEHVPAPDALLSRAMDFLRPNGLIWVEVPNDFNPLQQTICAELEKPEWWVVPAHHLNYFDFDSLGRLLEGVGLRVVERIASFPLEIFPLMDMDYIGNDRLGSELHQRRMQFEMRLLRQQPDTLLNLYRALAAAGLGRTCNLMAMKA